MDVLRRQLQGAAAGRPGELPQQTVGGAGLQLGGGPGVVGERRPQDPEEGGQPAVLLGVSSVLF